MDDPAQPFIRDYLVDENEDGQPEFRAPSDADPDGDDGTQYPMFIDPREGPPAPGERKGTENNDNAILSLVYTGGFTFPPHNKFRRKPTFDFWIRTKSPVLAAEIDSRLRVLLHDKRDWDMAGLQVIESQLWRPMQPVGSGPQGYSFTVSYALELYSDEGL